MPNSFEIPIINKDGAVLGRLRQIKIVDTNNTALVADLTNWRNSNQRFFLTQFDGTIERTANWLRNTVIADPSRAFYLIEDESNLRVGHLGVLKLDSDIPELDNMIRGVSKGDPQIMFWAEVALMQSLFTNSDVNHICLQVFSNNWIPIGLHQTLGFEIDSKASVRKVSSNGEVHYVLNSPEGPTEKFFYLQMTLTREKFRNFLHKNTNWGI